MTLMQGDKLDLMDGVSSLGEALKSVGLTQQEFNSYKSKTSHVEGDTPTSAVSNFNVSVEQYMAKRVAMNRMHHE